MTKPVTSKYKKVKEMMPCTRNIIRSILLTTVSITLIVIISTVRWTSISDIDILKEYLRRNGRYYFEIGKKEQVFSDEWMSTHKGISDYGDGTCHVNYETRCRFMLRSWMRLAQHYDVTYSIMFGSLLGAYRDGKLIPYDSDVDVIVDIHDVRRLWKLHGDERNFEGPKEYKMPGGVAVRGFDDKSYLIFQRDFNLPQDKRRRIMCNGTIVPKIADACSFVEPVARVVASDESFYVDIFAYVVQPNGFVHIQTDEDLHLKTVDVFPLKKCRFMDLETRCPSNPALLLKLLYGNQLDSQMKCRNTKWLKNRKENTNF